MRAVLRAAALASLLFLGACATRPSPPVTVPPSAPVPTPAPSIPPAPATARDAGVRVVPAVSITQARAAIALRAFQKSCPALTSRTDVSGLTDPGAWTSVCAEATETPIEHAALFFATRFKPVEVGTGDAFATGYYEPEIAGCRTPRPGCDTPIYAVPPDLVRGTFSDGSGDGRGRFDADGRFVLYHDRAAIDGGALSGRGLEIAYAADPVDLFFLQIQGSGRLRLDDGTQLRIGYAGQNGREYVAIGRLLRERGLMEPGTVTMERIKAWLREDRARGLALMHENPSYVFFRILEGEGPLGALNVAVTPQATVAADPKFVPLGAPVWLDLERDEADGLWVAQDTGGAIKGANRFDTFWGAGSAAEVMAGGLSAKGRALILLPKEAAVAGSQP